MNANIMSLGGIAIAIGVMVDASVVLVENLHKHPRATARGSDQVAAGASQPSQARLGQRPVLLAGDHRDGQLPAGVHPRRQQEGRLVRARLAWTKTFSMAAGDHGSAITVIPALMVLPGARQDPPSQSRSQPPLPACSSAVYRPIMRPRAALAGAGGDRRLRSGRALVALTAWPAEQARQRVHAAAQRGRPAVHADHATGHLDHQGPTSSSNRPTASSPAHLQVEPMCWARSGRAETATDPAPLSMIETTILLTPRRVLARRAMDHRGHRRRARRRWCRSLA